MILDIQLFILHFYGLVLLPIDLYILIRLELYCTPTTYTDPPMTYTNPPPLRPILSNACSKCRALMIVIRITIIAISVFVYAVNIQNSSLDSA